MITGVLIAESLQLDVPVAVPGLSLRAIRRVDVSASAAAEQPSAWTFIDFEGPSTASDELADALAAALSPEGGWYADYAVDDDHVVVFAGRAFRFGRGDAAGRAAAREHGRSVGVPEHQMDWPC